MRRVPSEDYADIARPALAHRTGVSAAMFKFVADNVNGAGTKRKQSPRSCESCKRRHVSSPRLPILRAILHINRRSNKMSETLSPQGPASALQSARSVASFATRSPSAETLGCIKRLPAFCVHKECYSTRRLPRAAEPGPRGGSHTLRCRLEPGVRIHHKRPPSGRES